MTDGTSCTDDGMFCTGTESCQSGVCAGSGDPCGGAHCDEIEGICLSGCPAGPIACRSAEKSIFLVKNKTPDSKDKLIWKWIKGENDSRRSSATRLATADYTLCVYSGVSATLVAELDVLREERSGVGEDHGKGYKYKDETGTEYGVQKIVFKASDKDKSKALVKGKGNGLPELPPATDRARPGPAGPRAALN